MMLPYKDNFVIIGGTACDLQLSGTTMMLELLSRHSDLLGEPSGFHIEPIPTDELHQSLSHLSQGTA